MLTRGEVQGQKRLFSTWKWKLCATVVRTGYSLVAILAAAGLLCTPLAAVLPPAGVDSFDSNGRFTLDLGASGGPEVGLTADGETRIDRSDPRDPGDGLHVIDTEILSMELRSTTPFGNVVVRESPTRRSAGIIKQQQAGVDFPADSFFDVFVEVETPLGNFHNETPIRLNAVIDAIPPFQAEYIPRATFIGVDLFNASGAKVGVIKHAAHFVGQKPSFSVAPGGPSNLRAADIFDPPTAVKIAAEMLGLPANNAPTDDVDGLSYGTAFISEIMDVRFSVDPATAGASGSVLLEAAKTPREAHGDEFRTSSPAIAGGTNGQVMDETGDTAPPFPLLISDDVDALAASSTSFVDADGDGNIDANRSVYFSLAAGSPSLATLGVTPGDILVTTGGATPTVFIPFTDLALTPTDDVDAFCLEAGSKTIVYSLARGSQSLGATMSAADLFIANPPPVGALTVFAPASALGLLPTDNVNALKCLPGEVDHFPAAQGQALVNGQPLDLTGPVELHVGVGRNGETPAGPQSSSGPEAVPVELVSMDLRGQSPLFGEVVVSVRPRNMFPGQPSQGVYVEGNNDRPGVFDLPPFTPDGSAETSMGLLLEVNVPGTTLQGLHHPNFRSLFGMFSHKPQAPGEILTSPGTTELFLEGGIPTGVIIENLSLVLNTDPPPGQDIGMEPGGVVGSAGFGPLVARNSIASGFGQNMVLETATTASAAPRTTNGETTVTVRDSEGGESTAQIFAIAPTQVNFLIGNVALGPAIVTVTRGDGRSATASLQVNNVAPGLYAANFTGSGVAAALFLRVAADGTRTTDLIFDPNTLAAVPIDLGPEGEQVFLLLFGTGIRDGTNVAVRIGGEDTTVLAAVAQGEFDGLDQVNVGPLSRNLIGRGPVNIELIVDGVAANIVTVTIQ